MIIKSEDRLTVAGAQLLFLLLTEFIYFFVEDSFLGIGFIISLIVVWDFIVTGHTLIMDEVGCTIKFLWYKRTYKWDELVIKRREYDYVGTTYKHSKGVFFAPYPVKKPKRMDPYTYCMFRHPFTCFFVFLTEPEYINSYKKGIYFREAWGVYLVVEEEFLKKMEEWGVELTEA